MAGNEIVVSLCDETGIMLEPWAKAGYECYAVDIAHSIRKPRFKDGIHYVWGDARTWRPPTGKKIVMVFGFPPCTHLTVAGARDFTTKGGMLLRDSLEVFEACRQAGAWSGAPYMVENPVGVLSNIPHIGKPDYYFDPCDYAGYLGGHDDLYTKKTCLWVGNGFVMPSTKPQLPTQGSKMHTLPPSEDRARIRSATPRGFAQAVFEANHKLLVGVTTNEGSQGAGTGGEVRDAGLQGGSEEDGGGPT